MGRKDSNSWRYTVLLLLIIIHLPAFIFAFMLAAQNLSKRYGPLTVVNDVSLHMSRGEVVAITGPSGAGKSSLLHLLGGLDVPDAGVVRLHDTELFKLNTRQQARFRNSKMGFVFQFHYLLPEFSAQENVAMPLWIGGINKKDALKQAATTLDRLGLSARLSHKPSELSGGEQQRVAIARAIVHGPDILFADEPTGNLDSANAESVHELFMQLRTELNLSVLMITHNEALAARTDRMLVMRDGRLVNK